GHTEEADPGIKATCVSEGMTAGSHCKICNAVIIAREVIPKLEHTWDSGVITLAPTAQQEGIKTYTCQSCFGTKQEEIPKLEEPEVDDNTNVVFSVSTVKGRTGKEVTVPVVLTGNTGIAGFSFAIGYDQNKLTLKSITAGNVISAGQVSVYENIVNWYTLDNVREDGVVLNLVFEISESAPEGITPVTVSLNEGKKNLTDEDGIYVPARYTAGGVEIISGKRGDINGDDDITIADVVLLNRYVLGKIELSSDRHQLADTNEDGDITIGDVVLLNRHVLGRINLLEKEGITARSRGTIVPRSFSGMTIAVGSAEAKRGETIQLPVSVSGNTGLAGFALEISVPNQYVLNSITAGNVISSGTYQTSGNVCTWYSADNVYTNGVLLILNITVGENASDAEITIRAKDGKANNLSDENGITVSAEFSSGDITIVKEEPHQWESDFTIDLEPTCLENGSKSIHCLHCEERKDVTIIEKTGHQEIIDPAIPATCIAEGKSEGSHCGKCGAVIAAQTIIPAAGHSWKEGVITNAPTDSEDGEKTYTCIVCNEKRTEAVKAERIASGTIVENNAANAVYKVCEDGKSVEFMKPINANKSTVIIPNMVVIDNTLYRVTAIADNAFKGNKKITSIVIGGNIEKIGKNAFNSCKKLKKIVINNTLLTSKSIGSKAFKGTGSKIIISVPKSKLKAYKKLLTKKGISEKAVWKKF
ncbi:MAG: leucine-rich repeat protein, partial [Parasporobacterium sp.]|nr:leucine-rich repeat protein [Parasporobacterium sp.]